MEIKKRKEFKRKEGIVRRAKKEFWQGNFGENSI